MAEPPTHTLVPTATPATEGGCLCVLAYDDRDGDGLRDDGEGLPSVLGPEDQGLAGTVVVVSDRSRVVATYTTNGRDEPFCFGLPYGRYLVTERNPRGYGSTTYDTWDVALNAEVPVSNLAFGDRQRQSLRMTAATPVPSLTESPLTSNRASEAVYTGGAALLVAVAGVCVKVGAGHLLKRERRK